MDQAFSDAVASGVATYVKRREPDQFPCRLRVTFRHLKLELLAFVGRACEIPCDEFVAELEERGHVVVGRGISEADSHWGVVVEPPIDEDRGICVTHEASSIR